MASTSAASGIVTILFTELVGHTSLYHGMGQVESPKLIADHFLLVRGVLGPRDT